MKFTQFLHRLFYLALLLAFSPGCQVFQSYRPVSVLAQDAETKKPIPGATVRITYPGAQPAYAPWESKAITGPDGVAHLQAAPYGDFGINVAVKMQGFMSEDKTIPIKEVAAIQPAYLFEAVENRPANYVLALYTDPAPTIEVLVPAAYHGLVRAEVLPREDIPGEPGQRCFRANVSSTGEARVTGPVLLKKIFSSDFTLKYADGMPLSWNAKESEVGFWWLKAEGSFQTFFVGTVGEYNAQYGHLLKSSTNSGATPSGQGGGKGRRNRGE